MVEDSNEHEAQALGGGNKKTEDNRDAIRTLKAKLLPAFRYTLLFSLLIYFAMFIVGILSVKKCPANENIPLFLCITGFVGLASKLVTYLRDRIIPHFQIKYVESALYTTESIFFILGTYWVYKEFQPSYDPHDGSKYCQKRAYMYAFIYITLFYAFILACIVGTICLCFCACMGLSILDKLAKQDVEANESQIPYIEEEVREQGGTQK